MSNPNQHTSNRPHPNGRALWLCEECREWETASHFANKWTLLSQWFIETRPGTRPPRQHKKEQA